VRVERGTHTHVSAAEARRMVCRFVVRIEAGGDPRPDLDLRVAILDVARSTWRSLVASDGGYETHAVPAGESVVCVKDGTSGAPLFARAVWLGDVEQVETLSLEARGVLAIERAKDDGEPMRLRLRHAESQVTWWATLSRRDGRATFPVGPGRYLVERRDAAGEWQVVDAAVVTSSSERTVRVPRPGAD